MKVTYKEHGDTKTEEIDQYGDVINKKTVKIQGDIDGYVSNLVDTQLEDKTEMFHISALTKKKLALIKAHESLSELLALPGIALLLGDHYVSFTRQRIRLSKLIIELEKNIDCI
tara:strand:- start:286 stop:627 length:342 start_codon:yes stop_codon:yes gene_type:complete